MKEPDAEEEVVELSDEEDDSYYVEAVVVIANGGTLLKASKNPYMMEDRPVVAFPWDVVPSRFWGRGVCEKGYNSPKGVRHRTTRSYRRSSTDYPPNDGYGCFPYASWC